MVTRRKIPDSYTDYEDGHIGANSGALANVEAKIGAAAGGVPGRVYTLSGPDAKKNARTLFKSGPLVQAIEEAFDGGSSKIYAARIGTPGQATMDLADVKGTNVLRLKGDYGVSANSHYVNIATQFKTLQTGYATVIPGSPNKLLVYDETMTLVRTINLHADIVAVAGVAMSFVPVNADDETEFWVLGTGPAPDSHITVWHLDADGAIIADDTLDLDGIIPGGDVASGIAASPFDGPHVQVVTDKHLLYILPSGGSPVLDYALDFAVDLGITDPDISSAVVVRDINASLRGEMPDGIMVLVDKTAKKLYGASDVAGESPTLLGEIDLSTLVDTATAEGLAYDYDTHEVLLALRAASGPSDRICRLVLDWEAETPTATLQSTKLVTAGIKGLAQTLYQPQVELTATFHDRNSTPWAVTTFKAVGTAGEVTALLAAKIVAGGTYGVETLVENPFCLQPTLNDGMPDPTEFVAFSGGSDGAALTNADYLAGLEAMKAKLDVAWIHPVEAVSSALWNATLQHCDEMFENYRSERFAILETPAFVSEAEVGSAAYLTALEAYVEAIVEMAELVGDRNAVIFAGGATFLGSDGVEYNRSITAACGGVMAGLQVQQSLINKIVDNALALVPEFQPGHIETLIEARVNCLRLVPGRGFIIAHSLTAAPTGSDYSRVNDLRAVYYGAKAAREAGQPLVGEENDSEGLGLRRLEAAMGRPLEEMRDAGQIDTFELTATSTAADRLLGDVYVRLGIQPRRAMEMIYTTVFLK